MRLPALLGKMFCEIRRQMRIHFEEELLNAKQADMHEIIMKVYCQQKNVKRGGTCSSESHIDGKFAD